MLLVIFPDTQIAGQVFDAENPTKTISGVEITIVLSRSGDEIGGKTDEKGRFSISCRKLQLGEADIVVLDPSEKYITERQHLDLKEKKFWDIQLQKGTSRYTIEFQKPSSYVDKSSPFEVKAVFRSETGEGTVRLAKPGQNVELLIDGMTRTYNEMEYTFTDRVTLDDVKNDFEIGEYEIRIVTRFLDTDGEQKGVSGTKYFSPLWFDDLRRLKYWTITDEEAQDWKTGEEGIKGVLELGDIGNTLWFYKKIHFIPVAVDFEARLSNRRTSVNLFVRFGRHYRVVIGDGDLRTVNIQRAKHLPYGRTAWTVIESHQLRNSIDTDPWLSVSVSFLPNFDNQTITFKIDLLSITGRDQPAVPQIVSKTIDLQGISDEDKVQIRIGHLGPWAATTFERSWIEFTNCRVYSPISSRTETGQFKY